MSKKNNTSTLKLVYAAACLALCLILPFLTGQIPKVGKMLSPMHLPVLLCGFLCGWPYGLAVGIIAAPLRALLFGMPAFPNWLFMCIEMAVYGLMTGLLYKVLPKKNIFIFANLLISLLAGRIVWGLTRFTLMGLTSTSFSLEIFLTVGFIEAVPGLISQLIIVPLVVVALQKAKLMPNDN